MTKLLNDDGTASMATLMMCSHHAFRRDLDCFAKALEAGELFRAPALRDEWAKFRAALHGHHDALVAMYHDQALIPVKLVDFEDAVNMTLGLPIVRTSPDHGTAYDLAGKGLARASSMQRALALAIEIVDRRQVRAT